MTIPELMKKLQDASDAGGGFNILDAVYPRSARMERGRLFFIARRNRVKSLYVATPPRGTSDPFRGGAVPLADGLEVYKCPMDHANARRLRELFPFTRPTLLGRADSFGFGDRLGIANPAHLRSLAGSDMRPVLAQQSIRELDRTQRTAEEVLDAASWAAFQEGYTEGFGADADHLKSNADIDRYAQAGFTMYTFDPSAYVVNEAATLPLPELERRARSVSTGGTSLEDALGRYAGRTFRLLDGTSLSPGREEITRAFLKYGSVLLHARSLYAHLKGRHASLPSEVELSVDETDIPTTPAEHLFVAGELRQMGLQIVSLAPRFIGEFEKGVDYKGDLKAFMREYLLHAQIAALMGPYKISIHSGSDKFSVYRAIGSLKAGPVHVKTAGTSYLEALRTVAMTDPALLREILAFACQHYQEERRSYNVTARVECLPAESGDRKLPELFEQHDARQIFHVTFGRVLTARGEPGGRPLFKDRLMACLTEHEDVHYENLLRHFRKHLDPFTRAEAGVPPVAP